MTDKYVLSLTIHDNDSVDSAYCFFCCRKIKRGGFWVGANAHTGQDTPISVCQGCIPLLGELAGITQADIPDGGFFQDSHFVDEEVLAQMIFSYWKAIADIRGHLLRRLSQVTKGVVDKLDNLSIFNNELSNTNGQLKTYLDSEAARTEGKGWVYLMHRKNGDYKIGLSGNVDRRLGQIKKDYPQVQLVHKIAVDDMRQAEAMLHEEFANKRQDGEWFSLSPEDVELIVRRVRFEDGWFLERYDNVPVDKDT